MRNITVEVKQDGKWAKVDKDDPLEDNIDEN